MMTIGLLVSMALANLTIDVSGLHQEYDFRWQSESATGREILTAEFLRIEMVPGYEKVMLNGVVRRFNPPPKLESGRLFIPFELADEIRRASALRTRDPVEVEPRKPEVEPFSPCHIVIDPGHGGRDPGTTGNSRGISEKEVNLDVALKLQRILEAGGATVTMTRSTDVFVELGQRAVLSNRVKPDLFLSIHANYAANPLPRGFEIWVPKNARGARDRMSRRLAWLIRREMGKVLSVDRGTKDERSLSVLRNTTAPAVLVELEFLSNRQAARQLADPGFRTILAEALADALRIYVRK